MVYKPMNVIVIKIRTIFKVKTIQTTCASAEKLILHHLSLEQELNVFHTKV